MADVRDAAAKRQLTQPAGGDWEQREGNKTARRQCSWDFQAC
jgi:hypothetical protein